MTLPISAVIATRDRPAKLANLFASFRAQDAQPAEIVVIDASGDEHTREVCDAPDGCAGRMVYRRAVNPGAASQRNEGVALATQPFVLFCDDDVVLEPGCLRALWGAMQSDPALGGVNAIITNQHYHPPGRISRMFYTWLNGGPLDSFAGRVIGPGLNFRAEDRPDLPPVVPVDWLDLGATLYRREALPAPPFDPFFEGYSYGEDLALSLLVARRWKLANARTARLFHDAVPGATKLGIGKFSRMTLVNRHHIMTRILGRQRMTDHLKLAGFEIFSVASQLRHPRVWRWIPAMLAGKLAGCAEILRRHRAGTGD